MLNEEQKRQIRMQQQFDQNTEHLVQNMPNLWYRMYVRLQKEGFDKSESMDLLIAFMEITHNG